MYGGVDPAMHIAQSIPFLAIPAIFVVLVGSWSTLVVNYISVGIDLKGLGLKVSRAKSTSINAIVVVLLALISFFGADIATLYFRFLLFLVIWMVPWLCIQGMDYFMVAKCDYSLRGIYGLDKTYDGYNKQGIICMIVGFFASYAFCFPGELKLFGVIPLYSPLMVKYFYYGDFSFFVGAVVTCALYYIISVKPRLNKLQGE
jgi:purine-cytosine permease-like protein